MSTLTEKPRVHDLILKEFDERYSRESVTFRNATGATASFKVGQTLKLNTGKYEADDGDTLAAVLLKNLDDVPNNTDVAGVPVLIRGPALLDADQLVLAAGSTLAGAITDLEALSPPIITVREPTQMTTG